MQITRILDLTQEEFDVLVKAGEILGSIKKALKNGEADNLSAETRELLTALSEITDEVLG